MGRSGGFCLFRCLVYLNDVRVFPLCLHTHIPTVRIRFRLAVLWPAFAVAHAARNALALLLAQALHEGGSSSSCALPLLCLPCYPLFIASTRPTRVVLQKKTNPLVVLYQRRSLSSRFQLSLPISILLCFTPLYGFFLTYLPLLFPIDRRCSIFANIPPASPRTPHAECSLVPW